MTTRKPDWLKIRITGDAANHRVEHILRDLRLNTICREGNCPNRMECFHRHTATFLILGKNCTRRCRFCNVTKAAPEPVDDTEPARVARAVKALGLHHVVVTSVTRDDLPDGGAAQFAAVVRAIREQSPGTTVELLIPDLRGDADALRTVVQEAPDILGHNVETVPRLYTAVRPLADYRRSLAVLADAKALAPGMLTKSGLMAGLGETPDEVADVLRDLRGVGCDILTVGQYLAPSREHYPVAEYVSPAVFDRYRELGYSLGFRFVASAPLVRSSYHADEAVGTQPS